MGKYINDRDLFAEINRLVLKGDKKVEELIPEDSFDLQNDRKISLATRTGNIISWSIYIDPNWPSAEYAEIVHWGTGDVKNYYKNSWRRNWGTPFLTSPNGVQFMVKARRYLQDNVI